MGTTPRIARYRKVYPRIWRHPGFSALNKTERELVLYLLSGPQTTRIGVSSFSVATAAEDLNVSVETLKKGLSNVAVTFDWRFDADARVFYIPSWWRWNAPENENVLKGCLNDLNEIPPSALVEAFAQNLETLVPTLHQTFTEGCAKRMVKRQVIQEQFQEHFQKQEQEQGRASRGAANGSGVKKILPLAREIVGIEKNSTDLEYLSDALLDLAKNRPGFTKIDRADVTIALNSALSERRAS